MAETEYSAATATPGLIVNDARKAMSLLSAAFYGYPQNELTVIGVTGTKGKTTTSYFTQALTQRRLRRQGRIVLLGR